MQIAGMDAGASSTCDFPVAFPPLEVRNVGRAYSPKVFAKRRAAEPKNSLRRLLVRELNPNPLADDLGNLEKLRSLAFH